MEVELNKAPVAETPASIMAEQMVEHITAIMMVYGGIESISATKYTSGFGSRLHVSISPFPDAPEEITAQGVVMKDAIAQIMSVANITRIVTKPSKEDLDSIREGWKLSVKDAKTANEGSVQIPVPGNSSGV